MFRRKNRRVYFEGVSKEAFGEMASGLASGTGGTSRRMVRKGFRRRLRRGHSAELSGRLRKGLSVGLRGHVSYIERLRKGGSFGVAHPESAFEGSFEGW